MTLLSKIKYYAYKKHLTKQISKASYKRKPFGEAKTIGILFDASSEKHREIVSQQAEQLRTKGKKVRILGFFNDKMPHEGTPYPYFNLKDIDWKFIPKKEVAAISDFIKQPFDLLYTYMIGENLTVDFITAVSQANFKASAYTETHNESHLMVDIQSNTDLQFLIRQLEVYLAKINKKYELAV